MKNISDFKNIKTPSELMDFMNDNITYGFISKTGRVYIDQDEDWNKDWFTQCIVQSGESMLKTKCGTCWDQVELERKWFQEHDYQFMTIFSWFEINKPNNYPTHTFLAYKENNKWYWFEHAFTSYRGIREFNSLVELISDVKAKQLKSAVESGIANPKDRKLIKSYEYKEPKPNLCVGDYIDHVVKGTLV